MSEPRNAPVQMPHSGHVPHGIKFRIPWRIHKKAWQEYAKHYSGQSALEIAERGGFGIEELIYLLAGEDMCGMDTDSKMASGFFGKYEEEKT